MKKFDVSKIVRFAAKCKIATKQNMPTILAVTSIALIPVTVYFAAKDTDRFHDSVDKLEAEAQAKGEDIKTFDLVKATGKAYWRTGVVALTEAYCVYKSNKGWNRKFTGMATSYATQCEVNRIAKERIAEEYGQEKANEVFGAPVKIIEKKQGRRPANVDPIEIFNPNDGIWFMNCTKNYQKHFPETNLAFLEEANRDLTEKIHTCNWGGKYLTIEDVLDRLGAGLECYSEKYIDNISSYGWTSETWGIGLSFSENNNAVPVMDPETGEWLTEYYVSWPTPKPLYGPEGIL